MEDPDLKEPVEKALLEVVLVSSSQYLAHVEIRLSHARKTTMTMPKGQRR